MKKISLVIFTFVVFIITAAAAQTKGPPTVTLSASNVPGEIISWIAPAAIQGGWAGCGSPSTCTYQTYVISGACPAIIVGSSGWSVLGSPTAALQITDGAEAPGSTESYVVYTLQSGASSGPSNCFTYTFPFAPSAPGTVQ